MTIRTVVNHVRRPSPDSTFCETMHLTLFAKVPNCGAPIAPRIDRQVRSVWTESQLPYLSLPIDGHGFRCNVIFLYLSVPDENQQRCDDENANPCDGQSVLVRLIKRRL